MRSEQVISRLGWHSRKSRRRASFARPSEWLNVTDGRPDRSMTTLLVTHPASLNHLTPAGHPERPDRLRAIAGVLAQESFQSLVRIEAPAVPLETIALCHPMGLIEELREAVPAEGLVQIDGDTT